MDSASPVGERARRCSSGGGGGGGSGWGIFNVDDLWGSLSGDDGWVSFTFDMSHKDASLYRLRPWRSRLGSSPFNIPAKGAPIERFRKWRVNEKTSSSFRVGNLTEAQTIQTLAQQRWPNTFRLACAVLGQPIETVTRQLTWEQYLGRPMEQLVPGTCAPATCTVCVEAAHRFKHRKLHGEATAVPCYQLIRSCFRDGIWTPGKGANVGKVLAKIQEMGGVPAITNAPKPAPCLLPLRSWNEHRLWDYRDDGSVTGRLYDRVAELLDRHGPCVGVLWVCPWYQFFDIDADDTLVYRGCGRNDDDRRMSEQLYRGQVGWHAVACFAYRFCGQQMHVQGLDNHSATGPRRWIDAEEFLTLYTLSSVWRLDMDTHG